MIKVLGLGDNVVDKYMHINTMYPGGNALNFAVYAKLLGIEAGYMGVFGDDEAAAHVYDTVKGIGLDLSHCRFYQGENGYAKVRLDDGDRVFIGSNRGGVAKEYPFDINKLDQKYLAGFDLIHTSIFSYIESQLPVLRESVPFISMDLSDRFDQTYLRKYVSYLDCVSISCGDQPLDQVRELMEQIMTFGCRKMVIATRGARGACLLKDKQFYEQSPYLVKAVDTMGAGDSFITCFLVNYADGMKAAADFGQNSGTNGITTKFGYEQLLIKTSLYRAAIYAADNCQKDGSFGYGKVFK